MGYVIKRGGKKQAFNSDKIRGSVKRSAKQARIPDKKIEILLKEVAEPIIRLYKNRVVRSHTLRRAVLGRLSRKSKPTAAAWIRYEKTKRQQ